MIKLKLNKKRVFEVVVASILIALSTFAATCVYTSYQNDRNTTSTNVKNCIFKGANNEYSYTIDNCSGEKLIFKLENKNKVFYKGNVYSLSYKQEGTSKYKEIKPITFKKNSEIKQYEADIDPKKPAKFKILLKRTTSNNIKAIIHLNIVSR